MKASEPIYYQLFQSNTAHCETEVIVFTHGLGLDLTIWSELFPYFRNDYHIILMDLRGHGNSPRGSQELNWELLVEDVCTVLNNLKVSRAHFVGHALGGYLGIQLAREFPNFVQSLTLLSTACVYPDSWGELIVNYRRKLAEKGMKVLSKELIPYICHPLTVEKERLLSAAYNRIAADTYFEFFHLISETDWVQGLQGVNCPILNLSGELDPIYTPNVIGLSVIHMTNSRYLIIPGASNLIQLDQPKIVSEWLINFIESKKERVPYEGDSFLASYYNRVKKSFTQLSLQDISAKELGIQVIESFRVEVNGVEVLEGWNQRNAKHLLFYLLVHQSATREELCDTLWPDTVLGKAKGYLRVSLNHLRKLIEQGNQKDFLFVDKEHIFLCGNVRSDFHSLKNQIQVGKEEQEKVKKIKIIETLLDQVKFPLFPGFYQEWVNLLREELENELFILFRWAMKEVEDRQIVRNMKLVATYKKLESNYSIYE